MRARRAVGALALVAVLSLAAVGCGAGDKISGPTDARNGKTLFLKGDPPNVDACGNCHRLADAGTTGTAGPDLDASFAYLKSDKADQRFDSEGVANVILGQILHPNGSMRAAKRPVGQDAEDVAAYVAQTIADE